MNKLIISFCCVFAAVLLSCKSKNAQFVRLSSALTGVSFRNDILENDSMNILDVENIYNGGGVGIGDFNRDGLPDVYFTGNMVANKLYVNKGRLQFEDVTEASSVGGQGKWCKGVAVVDINNDGWDDLYISASLLKDSVKRENILYVNQGLNKAGKPVFKNLAKEYGLADNSHTTQAAFFDYDNDGDLDVYLAVNVFAQRDNPNYYRQIFRNGEHPNTDRLYQNQWDSTKGHPVFTNVSREAGILQEGFAHSVTICDLNMDGWKDVFVANDYLSENLLWVNNGNGTFTNRSKEYFKHTAYNAMGADVIDVNNDGWSDVVEVDMNPEDNYRKKTMLGTGKYQTYLYNDSYGYQYQYIRNALHVSSGPRAGANDSLQHPVFSDIGFYSGIAETDWSWTPLVADFDRDGNRDILITNGFPKDITDHDFMVYRNSTFAMNAKENVLKQIPEVKISNYAYRNEGNLKFSNVAKDWGLDQASFSNGAAWADLDEDGDLEIIVNNINDEAFVYENKDNEAEQKKHYLNVKLEGNGLNKDAFGAWIKVYYAGNKQQVYEFNPVRGYLSSIEKKAFFGLHSTDVVDSLLVIWPDHTLQKLENIKADQTIVVKQVETRQTFSWSHAHQSSGSLFTDITDSLGINYVAEQNDFNDFAIQPLLPHKLSQYGPAMAKGDINNDGTEDVIIGSSNGRSETVLLQMRDGRFLQKALVPGVEETTLPVCDTGLELFDADGDGDLDLYIAVGGYEGKPGGSYYQDKFYRNEGGGNFVREEGAMPNNTASNSCVRVADYDQDGDLDLFVGGRVDPWHYPKPVASTILRNDSKNGIIRFTDLTKEVAPQLLTIGLVCDAVWTDYNNDGWKDLVIAGEWMPISFFKNVEGKLTNETASTGMVHWSGMWNCIRSGDFDGDGDIDFIAGNIGENSFLSKDKEHPVKNYYGDFDKNGVFESITTKYIKEKDGSFNEYTTHNRDDVLDQLPSLKKSFLTYKSFAETTFDKLFEKNSITKAYVNSANYFSSAYIKNLGNGAFALTALPMQAQFSSISHCLVDDFDGDKNLDVLICGNDFGSEVFNGRLDAFNGVMLKGDGTGDFKSLSIQESGFYVPGDAEYIVRINGKNNQPLVFCTQNKKRLKIFRQNKS
jgi:hypothetical protein